MINNPKSRALNRRQFLIRTGWVAGGLTILSGCQSILPILPTRADPEDREAFLWIQLQPDGTVRFYCPRMEMGQGASLGLTQIIAEELNLPKDQIYYELPTTADVPPYKMTTGSESIALFHEPISRAAAVLRETVRQRIASRLNLGPRQLKDAIGGFEADDGRYFAYKYAVQDMGSVILEDPDIDPETVPRYMINGGSKSPAIGQKWTNPDHRAIVTGEMVYSRDMKIPETSYGGVIRRPYRGAKLEKVARNDAENIPGVIAILTIEKDGFVGIVADNPFALTQAMERIEVHWGSPQKGDDEKVGSSWITHHEPLQGENFEHVLHEVGDVEDGFSEAPETITSFYSTPYAAHAAIEPRAAVVSVGETETHIWCGTQDPYFVRDRVADKIGQSSDNVIVHPLRMGGAFGGRVFCPEAEEAAILSAHVKRPVRVQWERVDEFQSGYCQPPFSHRIRAQVDPKGYVQKWQHDFVSSPIITGPVEGNLALAVDLFVADKGTARGAISPYKFPHQIVRYSDIRTNIYVGPWRGLGAAPNAFAIEGMMNELSALVNLDPFTFRLQNLPDEEVRLAHVLKKLREICDWDQLPSSPDVGRGIGAAIYKGDTRVAAAVEIIRDPKGQGLKINRVWCVQDCGRVINPDQVENQIVGNIIWGCSMAVKEHLTFENEFTSVRNFDAYEILRQSDAPEIMIALTDPIFAKPSAVGESALPPVPAAIAEAVFQITKERQRRLPINLSMG